MGTFISGGTWFNAPDDSPPMASGVEMAASARPPALGPFLCQGGRQPSRTHFSRRKIVARGADKDEDMSGKALLRRDDRRAALNFDIWHNADELISRVLRRSRLSRPP
jgi:hypothetical protein